MITAIAFDLEGTVVDVEIAHHRAHIASAKDVGLTLSLDECHQLLPHFVGGPDEKVAEEIFQLALQQGKKADPVYILKQKKVHYQEFLQNSDIKPRDGFLTFFEQLKLLGLKCTIGSVTNQEQAEVLLERSGVGKLFSRDFIVLREDVKNAKPAPDVWIATAKKAGVSPEQQIVFEDSPRGIQGAVRIGAYCIGMPTDYRPDSTAALLKAGAKRIFFHWGEINAQRLLENINQELIHQE